MRSRERKRNDTKAYIQELNTSKAKKWYNSYRVGLALEDENIAVYLITPIQSFSQHFPYSMNFTNLRNYGRRWTRQTFDI